MGFTYWAIEVLRVALMVAVALWFYNQVLPETITKKTVLGWIIILAISIVTFVPIRMAFSSSILMQIIVQYLLDYIYLSVFKKVDFGKKILLTTLCRSVTMLAVLAMIPLIQLLHHLFPNYHTTGSFLNIILYIVISKLLQFALLAIAAQWKYHLEYDNKIIYIMLTLLCLSSMIVSFSSLNMYSIKESYSVPALLSLLFCLGGIICSLIIINLFFKHASEKLALMLQISQEDAIKKYYLDIQQMQKMSLRMQHDFQNHITVMQKLCNSNSITELSTYLNELDTGLNDFPTMINTGNISVDAIINAKLAVCNDYNIETNIQCSLPGEINIFSSDICTILSNLIDNAIESCLKLSQDRYINILVKKAKDTFIFEVVNPTDGIVRKSGDVFLTRKNEEGHGLGLEQVSHVCKRYGGHIYKMHENKVFKAVVILANIQRKQ